MAYQTLAIGVLLFCVFSNGHCKNYPDPPIRTFAEYQLRSENNGLKVAVYPVVNKRELKQYFGKNLLKSGLLPIQIIYFNDSSDRVYTVLKEDISYTVGENEGLAEQPEGAFKGAAGKSVGIVSAIIISPIGLLTGGAMTARANSLRHNLTKKELRDQSLPPGGSTSGFIFIPIDEKKPDSPVRIWIKGSGDEEGESIHEFAL